jgi:peptidoglycan/LPS O-acetylase OafA/YrhL
VIVPALRDTLPPPLTALVTVLAAVAFSYLVYRVAERPLQELVRARRRRRAPGTPGAPSPAPGTLSAIPAASGEKASVP